MDVWNRYTYRVFFSDEDEEFVAVCAELPGLSWLDKNPEKALAGIRKVARDAVKLLVKDGDEIPDPLAARKYSGNFKVRVPPEVHRKLVIEAAEQGVSLNRLASAKLAG